MKIYKNQSYLRITLDTGVDISLATVFKIKYRSPDGATGVWNALLSGTTAVYKEFINNAGVSELNQSGRWILWAFVTFADSRLAPGEPYELLVYEEGN